MNESIQNLAKKLSVALLNRGWRVSCAESCTGGGVAYAITEVAGSSQWFDMGFVTYANDAKQRLVGVSDLTLDQHGAVSEAVVREMAGGALAVSGANLAVAISGVAGPDGGTVEKPVGTVWFGWAVRDGEITTLQKQFPGNRSDVRRQAIEQALAGLVEQAIGNR